jgi:hypothetical protein
LLVSIVLYEGLLHNFVIIRTFRQIRWLQHALPLLATSRLLFNTARVVVVVAAAPLYPRVDPRGVSGGQTACLGLSLAVRAGGGGGAPPRASLEQRLTVAATTAFHSNRDSFPRRRHFGTGINNNNKKSNNSFLPPTFDNYYYRSNQKNMLLRVRSNRGTWKVPDLNDQTATVHDVLEYLQDHYSADTARSASSSHSLNSITSRWRLSHPLSLDVGGKVLLDSERTLKEQNLSHGSMIYCRIQEESDPGPSSAALAGKENRSHPATASGGGNASTMTNVASNNNNNNTATLKQRTAASSTSPTDVVDLLSDDENDDESHGGNSVNLLQSSSTSSNDDDGEGEERQVGDAKQSTRPRNYLSSSSTSPICLLDDSDDDDKDDDHTSGNAPEGKQSNKRKMSISKIATPSTQNSNVHKRVKPSTTTATATASATRSSETTTSPNQEEEKQHLPSSFQVASYNIWFGPSDPSAGLLHPQQRMTAIVEELRKCHDNNKGNSPLWCIGFQEVTADLQRILAPQLIALGYTWYPQPGLQGFYGCALAIHQSIQVVETRFIPYSNTMQRRGILVARTNQSILFATTHLESYISPSQTSAKERQVQVQEMAEYCQKQLQQHSSTLKLAIFVGDLNWDDERNTRSGSGENENLLALLSSRKDSPEWTDAWLQCSSSQATAAAAAATTTSTFPGKLKGKKATIPGATTPAAPGMMGYTYDAKENPMLGGNLRRRFDRCLLLPATALMRTPKSPSGSPPLVQHFDFLGTNAIPDLTWEKRNPYNGSCRLVPVAPSDHFGIAITLSASILLPQPDV